MKTILSVALATLISFALLAQSPDSIVSAQRDVIFRNNINSPAFDAVRFAKDALDTVLQINPSAQGLAAFWHGRIGAAFLYKQQNDSAIVHLEQAKTYFSQRENARKSVSLAVLCQNLGIAHTNKRGFEKARAELFDAAEILKNNETPRGKLIMCQVYSGLTYALAQSGEHDTLVQITKEAFVFLETNLGKEAAIIGNIHQNLGTSYYYQGLYPEAEAEFKAAFTLYNLDEANHQSFKSEMANILNNLGGMRFEMGDYEEAVNQCASAIDFLNSMGFPPDAPEYLNAYSNIAQSFQKLGESAKAKRYFHETIRLLQARPDALTDVFATVYDGLGQTYLALEMPDSALDIHLTGLLLMRDRFGTSWHTAFMEFNIGKDYFVLKQWDLAKIYLNAAIETYRRAGGGKPMLLSEAYRILAEINIHQSQWVEALQLLDAAALAFSDLSDTAQANFESRYREAVFFSRAYLFLQKYKSPDRRSGDLVKAYDNIKLADYWLNRYRDNLTEYNPEILKNILDHTHLSEAILWEMYQTSPSQGIADEMFETADRGKSRMLFEQFRLFNALESKNLPTDTLKNLNAKINLWNGKIAGLTDTTFVQKDLSIKYHSKLAELRHQREALLIQLDTQDSVFAKKRREPPAITRAEMQALLAPDQCLIEYTLTDSEVYIFLLRKDQMLPPVVVQKDARFKMWKTMLNECSAPMNQFISDDSIRQRVAQFVEAAYGLYDLLLDTLRPHLAKHVTIVRDGELNYLPFEAFVENDTTGAFFDELPYLLHQFVFSYENTAALYREVRERKIKSARQGALVFAPFSDWGYREWHQLPKTGEGLDNLCFLAKGCDTRLGVKATKDQFLKEAPLYRFVHLSAHAQANDSTGKKSFILFRKPNSTGHNIPPDTLFAAEIFGLDFQAELISLNACETSHGELKKGEGIICLAWAFTGVGARSLITTLWRAEADKAAPFIFTEFYRHLSRGTPRDSALCQAKTDYLRKQTGIYDTHPFFWAPFILTGETKEVKF